MDKSRTEKNTKSRNVPQNIFLVKNSMNLRKKRYIEIRRDVSSSTIINICMFMC